VGDENGKVSSTEGSGVLRGCWLGLFQSRAEG
jgi:hypothetical protein